MLVRPGVGQGADSHELAMHGGQPRHATNTTRKSASTHPTTSIDGDDEAHRNSGMPLCKVCERIQPESKFPKKWLKRDPQNLRCADCHGGVRTTKFCTSCETEKDVLSFSKRQRSLAVDARCIECVSLDMQEPQDGDLPGADGDGDPAAIANAAGDAAAAAPAPGADFISVNMRPERRCDAGRNSFRILPPVVQVSALGNASDPAPPRRPPPQPLNMHRSSSATQPPAPMSALPPYPHPNPPVPLGFRPDHIRGNTSPAAAYPRGYANYDQGYDYRRGQDRPYDPAVDNDYRQNRMWRYPQPREPYIPPNYRMPPAPPSYRIDRTPNPDIVGAYRTRSRDRYSIPSRNRSRRRSRSPDRRAYAQGMAGAQPNHARITDRMSRFDLHRQREAPVPLSSYQQNQIPASEVTALAQTDPGGTIVRSSDAGARNLTPDIDPQSPSLTASIDFKTESEISECILPSDVIGDGQSLFANRIVKAEGGSSGTRVSVKQESSQLGPALVKGEPQSNGMVPVKVKDENSQGRFAHATVKQETEFGGVKVEGSSSSSQSVSVKQETRRVRDNYRSISNIDNKHSINNNPNIAIKVQPDVDDNDDDDEDDDDDDRPHIIWEKSPVRRIKRERPQE